MLVVLIAVRYDVSEGRYEERGRRICLRGIIIHLHSVLRISLQIEVVDTVVADLRELITNNVKMERIYRIAGGELELHQTAYSKELQRVNKELAKPEGDFRFGSLYFNKKRSLRISSSRLIRVYKLNKANWPPQG